MADKNSRRENSKLWAVRAGSQIFAIAALGGLLATLMATSARAENLPDASTDGVNKVKEWSWQKVKQAELDFSSSGFQRRPSPNFWGAEVIYQIQVDRFNNGDLANDAMNLEPSQAQGDLRGILDFRHGGDLQGITQRLDYLQNLGITTLWITPFLQHNGSYHGYCTTDPTLVDPGFGVNEDFRQLVKAAHQRGISVIMDVVVNHLCDPATDYVKAADHYKCANELDVETWKGQLSGSDGQGILGFSPKFFKPLKSQSFFNRCGANSQSDMEGTGSAAVYGDFVKGMFDFNTRNQDFQNVFTNLFKYWIAYADVDGFRLDAAKHVTEDFVAYFSTEIRHYARSIGKENFFIVGEVAGPSDWIARRLGKMYSNPQNPSEHGNIPEALTQAMWNLKPLYESHPNSKYPGLNASYDFDHGGRAIEVLHNRASPAELENHFRSPYIDDLSHQNDYRLNWNLLEIHDWPRFASHNKSSIAKSILGVSYLAFAEGAPIIYYGMEQGFNGDCHYDSINVGPVADDIKSQCGGHSHSLFRQDMFLGGMARLGSTVPEINKLAYIGPKQSISSAAEEDVYANQNHELFRSARKFLHLRKSCKALKFGDTKFRWVEMQNREGLLAFSRIDQQGENTFEALVVLNTGNFEIEIPNMNVNDHSVGKVWQNAMNGFQTGRTLGAGMIGFSGLKIGANSMMVFLPNDNVSAFDPQLGTHLCVQ